MMSESDQSALREWRALCLQGRLPATAFREAQLLTRFEAIVVHARRSHVLVFLASQGWQGATLNADYEIWQRARASAETP